jgi:phage shock protein E
MTPRTWILLAVVAAFLIGKTIKGRMAHKRAAEVMQTGAVVLDVRTAGEWQHGHHPDARHIPLDELQSRLSEIGPTTTPVVVYCHSGGRAMVAARMLRSAGYQDVINAGSLRNVPK